MLQFSVGRCKRGWPDLLYPADSVGKTMCQPVKLTHIVDVGTASQDEQRLRCNLVALAVEFETPPTQREGEPGNTMPPSGVSLSCSREFLL
jgi:hypothetical protein